ncbi:hypothetical protein BDV28DRAFT_62370 [Aspergillus coremiiformis]|uniref:Uncharacterized protein n=1 Tax=Aspergillus coremiiformis TaxID=138285 RepID=A0A5N6YVA9_9EURO|nr:hypothetical protein BDV28DRAFT_62370 [Aspergillus coremiiformis]
MTGLLLISMGGTHKACCASHRPRGNIFRRVSNVSDFYTRKKLILTQTTNPTGSSEGTLDTLCPQDTFHSIRPEERRVVNPL